MFELTNDFLIRFLVFLIVFFIAFEALVKTLKNKGVSLIIGLVLGLFSSVFLSYSQIQYVLESQSFLGIALVVLFPFLIVLFLLYSSDISSFLRRAGLIFYGLINIFLLRNLESISSETTTSIVFIIGVVIVLIVISDKFIKRNLRMFSTLKKN